MYKDYECWLKYETITEKALQFDCPDCSKRYEKKLEKKSVIRDMKSICKCMDDSGKILPLLPEKKLFRLT